MDYLKKLLRPLAALSLIVGITFGSATMMTGCDDDDPVEEAGDEIEEATD